MEIQVYKKGVLQEGYTCDPETGKVYSYWKTHVGRGGSSKMGIEYKHVIGTEHPDGYIYCTLGKVHRLIYESVYGPIPDGLVVNHIDEDKTNNCISNLNLMTPKENNNWGTRTARAAEKMKGKNLGNKYGERSGHPLRQCNPDTMEIVAEWSSSCKAAEGNPGFEQTAICAASKGEYYESHIYKGYYWERIA